MHKKDPSTTAQARRNIVVNPPGPASRDLASRLAVIECPEVTCLEDDFPIFWERARGVCVEDVDGNTYLDLTAAFAVAGVGHCHPRVVNAIVRQAPKLIHGMGDVHPTGLKVALAERLTALAPGDLGLPIFSSSGAEAVESARKTCAVATGRQGLVAFTGAYHGLTYGALEATDRDHFRAQFAGQWAGQVHRVPYPYCYRCPLERRSPDCRWACLEPVRALLEDPPDGHDRPGGVLIEPVQGRGGTIVPPPEYLERLRHLCDRFDVLLVFDEVFTGFGRTGAWFAADRFGVVPDVMAVGKSLGGGMPISACLGRPGAMRSWGRSTGEAVHTSTFLGHPLACAAALATLDVLEEERLPARAKTLGETLLRRLEVLQATYPGTVGDVRGVGLMAGLELVEDPVTREPASTLASALVKAGLREGLILLQEGPRGNVIGITPPLVIGSAELEDAITIIGALLDRLAPSPGP